MFFLLPPPGGWGYNKPARFVLSRAAQSGVEWRIEPISSPALFEAANPVILFRRIFSKFGGIVVDRWFRHLPWRAVPGYGGGTASPPTQPPIIEQLHFVGKMQGLHIWKKAKD